MASNVVPLQSPSTLNTPVSGTPEVPNFAPDNRIVILLDELQHPLQIHNYPNVGTSNSAASKVEPIKDINLTLKTPVENNKVANTPTSTPVKRICKPGDIIRMNSCSENVILNKKSYTVSKSNAKKIVKEKAVNLNKKKIEKLTNKIKDPKVQHEADAQFPSSNNPFSITKNVVHIEADEYDDSESRKLISNQVPKNKQLIVQSNANVKSNINNLTEYVPIKKVTNINKPMTFNNTLEGPATNIQKLSFTPSFKKSLPKTGLWKRKCIVANLSTASKTNSVIINSVDPTDTVSDNTRNLVDKVTANKSENKNTSKGYVVILSGSAKDLKIVRTGEKSSNLSISVDLTGASSSSSNDFRATVDTKASDTKKRQKTTVTSKIAKKIKQESFKILTLKDFDIDDNDDFVDLG
ncbi:unnamed protein product [Parnassius apollo]|uniref:(apollo) hypothetical protein n=1 Tax=Parnassius apollo TaxID=110799 RepID=A0A8S3WWY7_PARAO|nr:unnamed protein product [Parnassius apollo]